jgi:hypothetical protein
MVVSVFTNCKLNIFYYYARVDTNIDEIKFAFLTVYNKCETKRNICSRVREFIFLIRVKERIDLFDSTFSFHT